MAGIHSPFPFLLLLPLPPSYLSPDSGVDPWTRMKQEKKERVSKNERQRLSNLKAAGGKTVPGQIDLSSAIQPKPLKRSQKLKAKREEERALNDPPRIQLGKKRKHDDMEHLKVSAKARCDAAFSTLAGPLLGCDGLSLWCSIPCLAAGVTAGRPERHGEHGEIRGVPQARACA